MLILFLFIIVFKLIKLSQYIISLDDIWKLHFHGTIPSSSNSVEDEVFDLNSFFAFL